MKTSRLFGCCKQVLKLLLLLMFLIFSAVTSSAHRNVKAPPFKGPAVSKEQAVVFAITDMEKTNDGFCLKHRHFTACFTDDGVDVLTRRGGPDWHWQ